MWRLRDIKKSELSNKIAILFPAEKYVWRPNFPFPSNLSLTHPPTEKQRHIIRNWLHSNTAFDKLARNNCENFFEDLSLGIHNDVCWTKDDRWEKIVNINGFCKIVWSPDPNFPNIANHWKPRVPADFHTCQTFPLLTDLYANCHLPPPSLHTLPTLAPNHVNQRQARFLYVFTLYKPPHAIFSGFFGQLDWLLLPYFSFSPSSSSSGQNPSLRADQASSNQFKWSNFGALLEPETRVIPVAEMKGIRCQRSRSAPRTKCHEAVFSPRWLHQPSLGKVGKREKPLTIRSILEALN